MNKNKSEKNVCGDLKNENIFVNRKILQYENGSSRWPCSAYFYANGKRQHGVYIN